MGSRARDRRGYFLRRRYGISLKAKESLLDLQGHRCLICRGRPHTSHKVLQVDHDHDTEVVRGLTCGPCNRAIGNFQDSPENIAAALVYLASHGRFMSTPTLIQFLGALSAAHKIGENHPVISTA